MNDYGATYMDRRALMYLREYVKGETDFGGSIFSNVDTAHVASRLKYAGILESFTGPEITVSQETGVRMESWEGHTSVLSLLGEYLKEIQQQNYKNAFEFNFWSLKTILDVFPAKWLQDASDHQHESRESPSRHVVTNLMAVFQLEFPLDENVRRYLADRLKSNPDPVYIIELPDQFMDVPVQVDATFNTQAQMEADFSFDVEREPVAVDGDGFPLTLGLDRAAQSSSLEDEAADFDFGEELPDEEAGNMDQGGDDADFADDGPLLTPEEEADGWQV